MTYTKQTHLSTRSAEISPAAVLGIISITIALGLFYAALRMQPDATRSTTNKTVKVYCAAAVAKPVQQLVEKFNQQYGPRIEIARVGGSGELAGQIIAEYQTEFSRVADLFVTADELLLDQTESQGVTAERFHIAQQQVVIAVAAKSKHSFKNIRQLVDRDGIRFGIASKRAAVGRIARTIANREGCLQELEAAKTLDAENVMVLAQALAAGSIDAAIVWDTTVNQINQAWHEEAIKMNSLAHPIGQLKSNIAVGIVSNTKQLEHARKFARFLDAARTSQKTFEQYGFTFVPGDRWDEIPDFHWQESSMLAPSLEPAIHKFAKRNESNVDSRWDENCFFVNAPKSNNQPATYSDATLASDETPSNQITCQSLTILKNTQKPELQRSSQFVTQPEILSVFRNAGCGTE